MNILSVFLITICFVFSSCKPDPPPDPVPTVDEAQMVRELKEYTYFKEGTYWVYQDSATGILDSQYVYFAQEGEGNGAYWFDCFVFSSLDSFNYKHRFHSSWTSKNPYRSKVFRTKTKPSDYVGETILFEYPVIPGNRLYCGNNDTIITVGMSDSILVGSNYFHNTVRVDEESDVTGLNIHGKYYIGKNTGIVQHTLGNLYNWKLIRWNIIQ